MKKAVFSLLLFAILPQSGITQGVRIHNGFMKAEDFLHMSTDSRRDYAMGIVDGMLLAPAFGAPTKDRRSSPSGPVLRAWTIPRSRRSSKSSFEIVLSAGTSA